MMASHLAAVASLATLCSSLSLVRPARGLACRHAAATARATAVASDVAGDHGAAASTATPSGDNTYHVPVLCAEAVEWLITDPRGTYVDATLGGGGHTAALLEALAPHGGHIIGVDRDPNALAAAGERLAPHLGPGGAATLLRSNFGALADALPVGQIDGLLLDLGVSSHQLDEPSRGFSFMRDGPLDMRMDGGSAASSSACGSTLTAETILNTWDASAIADVLWAYGEERESRRIARAIVGARPLRTTGELAAVLRTAGSKREPKEVTKRCARVFQALRIEVNQEMAELEAVLTAAAALVRPGGRLAVMSYHSLEDRRVKRLLRSGSFGDGEPPKDVYGNLLAPWTPLTRQPVLASADEVAVNSRSRSVRLRIGERSAC